MLSFLRALGKSEHERIQERLSAYLDGELSARDQAAVEQHLRTCGQCARNLETLRWTVNLVREVPMVPLPRSFTVRPAALEAARLPRRAGLGYAYLRGATTLAAVLLALVLSADVLSQFFTAPALAPQVVEKEVMVEQAVVQTVVVEKEVVVERPVAETVAVEAEKVVEKAVVEQKVEAVTPPPVERAMAAQTQAAAEEAMPEVPPTASPLIRMAERVLATPVVEEELRKTDVGAGPQATPAPLAPTEAPVGAAPAVTEAPPELPTAEVAGELEAPAAAAPTPAAIPTEVAHERPVPSPKPSPAGRQLLSAPSDRGLSLLRQLEIGLLMAVIVLGAATLAVRKGQR